MDEAPETAPITWSQQSIWSLHRHIEADSQLSRFYNLCNYVKFDSKVSREIIGVTLDHVIRRHPSLRTTFRHQGDGVTLQVVAPDSRPKVEFHQEYDIIGRYGSMEAFVEHVRSTVLRPSLGPPVEFHVICDARSAVGIVALVHHLCADGMGLYALEEDFRRVCEDLVIGRPIRQPNPGIQPLDQSRLENSPAGHRASERSLEHWKQTFTIPTVAPALPANRKPGKSCDGVLTSYRLPSVVPSLATMFGLTPGEVMLALYAAMVSRFTGLKTCRITCLCSNRMHSGMSVSCSFQMTPVLLDLRKAETFEDAVDVLKEQRHVMMEFARYDHNRRVAETVLAQERTGHNLVHRIEYNYLARSTTGDHGPVDELPPSDFWWEVGREEPMPDLLNLTVTGGPEGMHLRITSDVSTLDREEMRNLLHAIEGAAIDLTRNPHQLLSHLTREMPRHHRAGNSPRLSRYHGGLIDLDHTRQVIADVMGTSTPVEVFIEGRHQSEQLVAYVARDMEYLELYRLRRLLLGYQYEDPGFVVPTWFVSCGALPDDTADHHGWRTVENLTLKPGYPPPRTDPKTEEEEVLSLAVRSGCAEAVVNMEVSYVECGGHLGKCEEVVEDLLAAGYTGITMSDLWKITPLRLLAQRLTKVEPHGRPRT